MIYLQEENICLLNRNRDSIIEKVNNPPALHSYSIYIVVMQRLNIAVGSSDGQCQLVAQID